MRTLLVTFVTVTASLWLCALPVVFLARRKRLPQIARRFLVAAVGIGAFFGVAAVVSESLIEDCAGSGSIACLDIGFRGFLFLAAAGYVIAAVIGTIVVYRR